MNPIITGKMLSPKILRYRNQYIPFITIWIIFGALYSLLEYGLLGDSTFYPSTKNYYNFKDNVTYIIIACAIMGLVQAHIETFWLKKRFQQKALWLKMTLKTIFYVILIILFLVVFTTVSTMKSYNEGPFGQNVLNELVNFISAFAFWSIVIYICVCVFLALLLSEINDYLGSGVFQNFLFGKYHKPIEEVRIFMFLDMKSSTTIAEKLGHRKYFDLIRNYYADMTNAILESYGHIYQYVGDEIVVSWTENRGLLTNNCIECFFRIESAIKKRQHYYLSHFGVFPEFKAGFHIGKVTTGEIGIIKKDIIYTGDVLNTTARIQAECNTYNSKIIISEDLKKRLTNSQNLKYQNIGKLKLRGKQQAVVLYDLKMN